MLNETPLDVTPIPTPVANCAEVPSVVPVVLRLKNVEIPDDEFTLPNNVELTVGTFNDAPVIEPAAIRLFPAAVSYTHLRAHET